MSGSLLVIDRIEGGRGRRWPCRGMRVMLGLLLGRPRAPCRVCAIDPDARRLIAQTVVSTSHTRQDELSFVRWDDSAIPRGAELREVPPVSA